MAISNDAHGVRMRLSLLVAAWAAVMAVIASPAAADTYAGAAQLTPGLTDQPGQDPNTPVDEVAIDVSKGATLAPGVLRDPWEPFNRRSFAVFNALDHAIVAPAARGYRAVTPKPARRGIRRFLHNLRSPAIFANDLLQGHPKRAGATLGRFLFNTTLGLGGFLDPAAREGIPPHDEDFGQTLAVWGVSPGPYLVVPLFGPTTIRDGFGLAVDIAFDPLSYFNKSPYGEIRIGQAGVNALSQREAALDPLAEIEKNSLDYYASLRSLYGQARQREITNGKVDYDALPDIGDFEDDDDLQ